MKNFTITLNGVDRHFAVELSGVTRSFEIRQGVGPAGPPGATGPAGPNEVTSATTSDGTATLLVETISANNPASNALIGSSTVGNGLAASSINGYGADIISNNNIGAIISSADSTSLQLNTVAGNYYLECQNNYTTFECAIERVRGWFVWFYNTFTGRLKTADITADRDWTLPDRTGNIALTEDYTGGTAVIDVLTATVQGTLTANHIHGNLAGALYAHIRAGEDLAKGDPVYVSGFHAGSGYAIVSKADASNSAKMPAIGVMDAAVLNNANGHMVINGTISDVNTAAYAVNDTLYVASGGGFTSTPPAANSQPVARVDRVNTNNGAIIVKVNGLASSGGNGASDANKLVRYPSAGSTGSGAIVQATSPTLTSPTLTGTPNFTATNYTFASDARIGFLNNLSSQFVYKNGTIPYAEIFEDFPVTTGTHGFISAGGTVAYYAPSSTNAARYWGALSLTTGATTDNTAIITLAPSGGANGQTTSRFGLSHQICFCVNNATSSEFRSRIQGSGITFDCAVLFGTGVVQLESANIGGTGVNTVSVATGLTLAAGDFVSGTRYRLFVRCVSATQTEVYLASAPWNSETWTTLVDTIVTHSTPSITNVSTQPVYFVTTKTNAARIAYVDWVAIRYAIQR